MADPRNFQDFMMKKLKHKQLQEKLENIFTSSRVPGTYLRNPEPSRAGKLTDMLTSGLESLGVGGQTAYNIGNFAQSMTPAASLDDLDRGDPTSALESVAGGPAQAMFVGPMARGIDQLALKEARGLARAGAKHSRILKDTGWFRGRDEKWRTEIDDSAARIHGNRSMGMGADDVGAVGLSTDMRNPDIMNDVFTHAKLYEAYPELAEYGVNELDPALAAKGYGGSFGRTNRKLAASVDGGLPSHNITMASGAFGEAPAPGPRKTMLHELQHAVQGIEGFEGGTNPDWVTEMAAQGTITKDAFRPFWQRALREGYDPKVAMSKAAHDIYERNAGEAEARLTANRADITPGTRRRIDPTTMFDVPFNEQWMWNRDIDDMLKGGRGVSSNSFKGWVPELSASKKNPWQEMYHGSRSAEPFDVPVGDRKDVGLHLTRDPNIADKYAGIDDEALLGPPGAVGGRVYPVLVNPGKTFMGRGKINDPIDWNDPKSVVDALITPTEFDPKGMPKDVADILADVQAGTHIKDAFKNRGYNSVEYDHYPDPYSEPGHALMTFDGRVVPKFSPEGQKILKESKIKKPKKRNKENDEDIADYWGGWAREN